jgi:hypothetical protein
MKLAQASKAEQDAAIAVAKRDVDQFIDVFMGSGLASMYRYQAHQALDGPQGRALVLKVVDDILAAAEKVRNATPPPPPIQTRA